ncbi:MAG: 3-deoxy-8-phosphooctulonate synthase, partial [Pirellula staleyi]
MAIPSQSRATVQPVRIGRHVCGDSQRLLLIAGPCVIESLEGCLQIAETVSGICDRLGVNYVFKASFDMAFRTSG